MNYKFIFCLIFCLLITSKVQAAKAAYYLEMDTGDTVIIEGDKGSYSVGKYILKANYCLNNLEFICFITEDYFFVFPRNYGGQEHWQWNNFHFCVANNKNPYTDDKRVLVYVWDSNSCQGRRIGSYVYSKTNGLQYISSTYIKEKGKLELVSIENSGFGVLNKQ
jgi:hypothetical protein